jgi:hypothetical protein
MLHSQQIPHGTQYKDEATILSTMFSEPVLPTPLYEAKKVNIEMVSFATPVGLSSARDDDLNMSDESSLLISGLVDGFWAPIREDPQDPGSIVLEGDDFRFKRIPKIWQCVKNAFSMPDM